MSYSRTCGVDAVFVAHVCQENRVFIGDAAAHKQSVVDKDSCQRSIDIRHCLVIVAADDEIGIRPVCISLIISGIEADKTSAIAVVDILRNGKADDEITILYRCLTVEKKTVAQLEIHLRAAIVAFGAICVFLVVNRHAHDTVEIGHLLAEVISHLASQLYHTQCLKSIVSHDGIGRRCDRFAIDLCQNDIIFRICQTQRRIAKERKPLGIVCFVGFGWAVMLGLPTFLLGIISPVSGLNWPIQCLCWTFF